MKNQLAMVLLALSLLAATRPVFAQEGFARPLDVTSVERLKFAAAGGVIHIIDSFGYLSVDGWDEPEVEITTTKSTDQFYKPKQEDEAKGRLERIRVVTQRTSDTDLTITTIHASRNGTWAPPLPPTTKAGVTVEYQIRVPRASRLVIHHDTGYVWVNDVTGDVKVDSHTGDMIVMLPDPGAYSIDARTRFGSVTSDFAGKAFNQFVFGTHFADVSESPSRRIYLRMGRGSITIKKGPPSGPFEKD